MRTMLAAVLLAACGAGAAAVWWLAMPAPTGFDQDAARTVATGPVGPRPPGPTGPDGRIEGGEVASDPKQAVDPEQLRREGEPIGAMARWWMDSRERPTFSHLENGQDVPADIAAATGMTSAEAKIVANVQRGENTRLAAALRTFTKTLEKFAPTAEQVAAADAYELVQMVTGHQGLYLEMAPFMQNMDDETQRRFIEERRPWIEFFEPDSTVIRLCKVMHAVRAESYQKMRDQGVTAGTIDKLQARYLLPGHFRYPGNNGFEFGPPFAGK